MIVDDNQTNLDILRYVLESLEIQVHELTRGTDVVSTLEQAVDANDPFDLAILDIRMPDMNGYDIARAVRSSALLGANLPLLAFSSSVVRAAKRCQEAGFDGFLPKPIRRQKLLKMIENLLSTEREGDQTGAPEGGQIITQYSVREEMKRSVSLLLAEDNPVNQKLARMMLKKAGYQVEIANNGKEALQKFSSDPETFHLIFMDVQMPEMDGMEATRAIRKAESKRRNGDDPRTRIPIIAMTANAMAGDREKCLEAGMDDYVSKPIKRELVFQMIDKYVLNKEA